MILAIERGDGEAAEKVLAPLLEELEGDPTVLQILSWIRLHAGRFEDARDLAARARAMDEEDPWSHEARGEALLALGRREEAVAAYRTAIGLFRERVGSKTPEADDLRGQGMPDPKLLHDHEARAVGEREALVLPSEEPRPRLGEARAVVRRVVAVEDRDPAGRIDEEELHEGP
jgi:tetratricopeptide (TPR) repeat protein